MAKRRYIREFGTKKARSAAVYAFSEPIITTDAQELNTSSYQVDFVVTSPLCLASVSAAAAKDTTLQSLLELSGPRENAYKLSPQENLLLSPPTDFTLVAPT